MLDALRVHGAIRGLVLGSKRMLRCQPFGGTGIDPVPGVEESASTAKEPTSADD